MDVGAVILLLQSVVHAMRIWAQQHFGWSPVDFLHCPCLHPMVRCKERYRLTLKLYTSKRTRRH